MEVVTALFHLSCLIDAMHYAGPVRQLVSQHAAGWAAVGLDNIRREFPNDIRHTMDGPHDHHRATPRTAKIAHPHGEHDDLGFGFSGGRAD